MLMQLNMGSYLRRAAPGVMCARWRLQDGQSSCLLCAVLHGNPFSDALVHYNLLLLLLLVAWQCVGITSCLTWYQKSRCCCLSGLAPGVVATGS